MYLNAEKITFFLKEVKIGKMAETQKNSDNKMMNLKKKKKLTELSWLTASSLEAKGCNLNSGLKGCC